MYTQAQLWKQYFENEQNVVLALPGGIWTWEETGRLGISFTNTPLAFDRAVLMPCMLIKTRLITPTFDLRDEPEQIMSYKRTVQFFIYQENGTSVLEETYNLVYNLIQDKQPFPGVRSMITNVVEGLQEESLNGANFIRIDAVEFGIQMPT